MNGNDNLINNGRLSDDRILTYRGEGLVKYWGSQSFKILALPENSHQVQIAFALAEAFYKNPKLSNEELEKLVDSDLLKSRKMIPELEKKISSMKGSDCTFYDLRDEEHICVKDNRQITGSNLVLYSCKRRGNHCPKRG